MRKLISLLSLVIIGSSVMTPVGFADEIEEAKEAALERESSQQAQEDFQVSQQQQMERDDRAREEEVAEYEAAREQERQDAINFDRRDVTDERIEANEEVNLEVLENSPEVAAAEAALPDARFEADVARAKQAVAEAEQGFAEGKVNEALKALDEATKSNDADAKEEAKEAFDEAYDELEAVKADTDAAKAATDKAEIKVKDLENTRDRAIDAYYQNKKSVLPQTLKGIDECKVLMNEVAMNSLAAKEKFEKREDEYIQDVLGCGIKTGDMRLWMIPYYIRFILEFLLQIAGLVAVGGIVFGGYLYMFAGVSDEKDRGKKAIMYGVAGIIVAMVAWGFVNILISFLTG